MPVATETLIRCTHCGYNKPRKDMSAFDSLCRDCFERHYAICIECGRLVQGGGNAGYYNSHHIGGDCYQYEGDVYCYDCYYIARNRTTRDPESHSWRPEPMDYSCVTYQRIGSKRKFGVEIETSRCTNHHTLHKNTKFGSKHDCSVSGMEFDSPILYGDEGLQHIEEFLGFAHENHWRVDEDCGCHIHLDMRDESDESLWRIAYAYRKTYDLWSCCVSYDRRDNSYCHRPDYRCSDIRRRYSRESHFQDFAGSYDRYDYMNLSAYWSHKTFELRLLEGTLDAETLCNWVIIHTRFADYVKNLTFDEIDEFFGSSAEQQFAALTQILNDSKLEDWIVYRADELGGTLLRSANDSNERSHISREEFRLMGFNMMSLEGRGF